MKKTLCCGTLMVVSLLVLVLSGCKSNPNVLLGTYAVERDGQIKEFMRIEKKGDKFLIYEKDRRKWLNPAEVSAVDEIDLERMLGMNIPDGYVGIGNEMMAVLSVRKGWKLGEFQSKTGFVLASSLGPMDLYPEQKQ